MARVVIRILKWSAIVLPVIAVIVLLVLAFMPGFFFVNQWLTPATAVIIEGEGFSFHLDKDAVTVIDLYHIVGEPANGHSYLAIEVIPHKGYQIDTLHLQISGLIPPQALTIEEANFDYQRTDYDQAVSLRMADMDIEPSQRIKFTCDLDVAALDEATPEKANLFIGATTHEDSLLKIVQYSASATIQIAIPQLD